MHKKIIIFCLLATCVACATAPKPDTWQTAAFNEKKEIETFYSGLPGTLHEYNTNRIDHIVLHAASDVASRREKKNFLKRVDKAYKSSKSPADWAANAKAAISDNTIDFVA